MSEKMVEFNPNDYREKFADYTIEECIEEFNKDVGHFGWVSARGRFHAALREKFIQSNYDCSDFISANSMSLAKKVQIEGDKIVQFE